MAGTCGGSPNRMLDEYDPIWIKIERDGEDQSCSIPGAAHQPCPAATSDRGDVRSSNGGGAYGPLRDKVQRRLLTELSPTADTGDVEMVRRTLERIFAETLAEERIPLSRTERGQIFEQIVADVLGYGPIEPYLRDESVTEILVNGPDQVYIERNGILERADIRFRDSTEVMRIIDRIVAPLGRRVDESSPMVDARLPDGSRVNIIIPPLSLVGPCISIRKFAKAAYTAEDMIRLGTVTQDMVEFLAGLRAGPAQHRHLRGHLHRQDNLSERPVQLSAQPGADRDHRGCGRAAAQPEPRRAPGVPPAQRGGQGPGRRSGNWSSTPCACGRTASWSARCAAARRWTCCRP